METSAFEFSARLADLWRRERGVLADFVLALAEFDRRRLWAELGHPHLWSYLRRELGLSEALAQSRQVAARLVQRFPQVVELLRNGRLCVTNLVRLADVLTPENCDTVLMQACGLGKGEVEHLCATLAPKPPKRNVLRKVTAPARPELELELASTPVGAPPSPADRIEALSQKYFRLHMTVTTEFVGRLKEARDALGHKIPDGDIEAVLLEGLRLILAQRDKRRALTDKPRPPKKKPQAASRYVPAQVRRTVWTRDEGRCQWPMGDGICGETRRVEVAHIVDYARGGPPTAENLMLLCAPHNHIAADWSFGRDFMERHRGRPLQPAEACKSAEPHISP